MRNRRNWIGIASILAALLAPPFTFSQDSKENSEFKLAVGLYNDGMLDLASEQLKNFITAYPTTSQGIEARFYLGLSQMKMSRFDEARVTFQNFALTYVDHPRAPEAWINVGDAFLGLKNDREAASAYERVKVFHPKSGVVAEALLKAGEIDHRIGEREAAKKNFRTIIQDYPSSTSVSAARLALSGVYAEEGQTALAEQEARRVSESEAPPEVKARALLAIGKLELASSLFDKAEATFKSVNAKSAAAAAASFELGKLASGGGLYAPAIEYFSKVLANTSAGDSLRAASLMETGNAFEGLREFAKAGAAYGKLLETFPQNALAVSAALCAARADLAIGNFPECLARAKSVLTSPESAREALILAAEASAALHQYNDAARFYLTYADLIKNPATVDVLLKLAALYNSQLHDARKAMNVYDQIVQQYPQEYHVVDALIGIGGCQEQLGDPDGAMRTFSDIQIRYPANDAFDRIGQRIDSLRNFAIKDRDAGIAKLARLIGELASQHSKPDISFRLSEIYFHDLKDYESAAAQFGASIEAGLDEKQLPEALFYRARSYHLLSVHDTSARGRAVSLYDSLLLQYPSSPWSDDAAYYSYQLTAAASRLPAATAFVNLHPSSVHRDEALFDAGNASAGSGDFQGAVNTFSSINPGSLPGGRAALARGDVFQSLHQPDSARECWQRAADRTPPDPSAVTALWNLANLAWQSRRYDESISRGKRLIDDFYYCEAAERARPLLADAYLAAGRPDEAIEICRQLLEKDQSGGVLADVFFRLATAYEKKGDRKEATLYCNKYLLHARHGVNAGKAYYTLGGIARAEGNTERATAYFRLAASLADSGSATSDIADLLFQTEQYADASRQYRQLAASAESTARQTYQARAIVAALRAGQLPAAQELIGEFAKRGEGDAEHRAEFEYETGMHYFRQQDYTAAKQRFEKVAGGETRFGPWGRYYIGKISESINKPDEAAKTYEEVLNRFPQSDVIPRVLLSLGNMHFNAERFEVAIKYFRRILDSSGVAGDIAPYALSNLIESYESTKLYDAALKAARDFIERFPNDESITDKKIKVGILYTKLGYYDQAVVQFQHLIDDAGSAVEAELRYDIGEAYYNKGDYQQAVLEFLKVPYLVSTHGKVNWTAPSLYMAGQAYEKESRFDEAISMYQQVIDRKGIEATFKAAAQKEIDRVKSVMKKGNE